MPTPRRCRLLLRWTFTAATAALTGALTLAGILTAAPTAQAADPSAFDPGLIISDSIFFDSSTMDAYRIQLFLDQMGANCQPGPDGTPCLRSFRQDTQSRAATDRCPGGYVGAAAESAATIIQKVSRSCGINPQVILVTLQKEQSLVRGSGASLYANRYRSAMGYGCPDGAPCDALYYGFVNQVYSAASQFRNYSLNPTRYAHRAGVVTNIWFHPNTDCGSSAVLIQNQATAGLYNYTPYQPNAAALVAGYGTGDSCSSYGNRNFWNYFTDWFGPTTQREPVGTIDAVTASFNSITVSGWAFDPDTTSPIAVHIYVDGAGVGGTIAQSSRPDVGAVYGKGDLHGYGITVPAKAGPHGVCAYAIDSAGGVNPQIGCRTITVTNRPPTGVIDTVTVSDTQAAVSGWAFDPDTTSPIAVHIYVDGAGVGGTIAQSSRPDVGAVYGKGDLHGYGITVPVPAGTHQLCAYGIDSSGGVNPQLACRTITVMNRPPLGVIDAVNVNGTQATTSGWAFDPDSTASIAVHVYVDGVWASSAMADGSRPDVAAVYDTTAAHGYSVTVTTTPGTHQLCVYAIDTAGPPNPNIACRGITVAPSASKVPVGVIDAVSITGSTATVSGWALDPDTDQPISVEFYLDGARATGGAARLSRLDVAQVYGTGPLHGYLMAFGATAGTHTVCLRGLDSSTQAPTELACRPFTVAADGVNAAPVGVIDTVQTLGSELTIAGWAFDPDTTAPIAVHVYVDQLPSGATVADLTRLDVEAVYGNGSLHGYTLTIPIAPGVHNVCAYGIDASGGPNPGFACRSVTVG